MSEQNITTEPNKTPTSDKKTMYTIASILAALLILGLIISAAMNNKKDDSATNNEKTVMVGGAAMSPTKNIIENVSNASNLTTLVAAVKAADLVPTLQGAGPFTVFGPDNNAFAKLPAGTVDTLLKPENKTKLQDILKYHVVSGKYLASDLTDGQTLTTVQGENLTVTKANGKVSLKDVKGGISTVTTADVVQSNGVAHVVDTLLMPTEKMATDNTMPTAPTTGTTPATPSTPAAGGTTTGTGSTTTGGTTTPANTNTTTTNPPIPDSNTMTTGQNPTVGGAAMARDKDLVTNVSNAPNLTTLVAAVKAADLVATLQGPGPFTVFGPDNMAFAKLPAGTVDTLVKPENKATLTNILTYHVVSGKYLASDLTDGQVLITVQGEKLTVMKSGGKVTLKDAKGGMSTVTTSDVVQSNGVAHVVDTVLMPSK